MNPKLLLGKGGCGKTTRILQTVRWLNALVICYSNDYVRDLKRLCSNEKGFEGVNFVSAKVADTFIRGRFFDIVCVDEWRKCYAKNNYLDACLKVSKIQPVFTERLDTDNFDVEIM